MHSPFRPLAVAVAIAFLPFISSANADPLITREYKIHPTTDSGSSWVDNLKAKGVEFPEGASAAVYVAEGSRLVVRNTQTNLDLVDALFESFDATPTVLSLQDEIFSLPIEEARQLLADHPSDSARYNKLRGMLKDKTAKIERLCVLRTKPGERTISESTTELRLAGEVEIKTKAEGKDASSEVKFETSRLGDSIEMLPQLGANGIDVDVEIIPARVNYRGDHPTGLNGIVQPILQVQKLQTKVSLQIGKPYLLGTLNPPFGDGLSEAKEQRVWLEFLTANFPQE